ncbi:hypothetical protein [Phormidium tenue]|uniref:Uncharacterized protein n=1 Tax=Phormidium tenue NIES-30 TaxID=549789 RepID=A0A1U7J1K7_9CYAN|nr:hypothetical protein [Phormidium tenue]MBD2232236.1 hypothetical protein [Phormidium tenue FACHB-1052]OKH45825.1 hypothetical protein NIES30_18250 [Phormidium tenue NIES-30]
MNKSNWFSRGINFCLNYLSRTVWQLFISLSLFLAALAYEFFGSQQADISIDIKSTNFTLGVIGSILALATSISFSFMVFSISQANNRKHDLFYRFKSMLFEFDSFLKDYPATERKVSEAQALSWQLKFIKLSEFPLFDWGDTIKDLTTYLTEAEDYEEDLNLDNKILGYLGFLEETVSEIGLICINQITSQIYVDIVIKILALITLLIVTLISGYLNLGTIQNSVLSCSPVFFASFSCLIFLQVIRCLKMESKEILNFVEWENSEGL